ncbi:cytidylyltransferase domain-containing protein [Candidatus Omnitrophota bacterium]
MRKAKKLDTIIVATSTEEKDDAIAEFCLRINIPCFRGSENDVLARYYYCAKQFGIETIVRLTADCPLIDPDIIDSVIKCFFDKHVDYAANTIPQETSTFPDGSDVEVFSMRALSQAFFECNIFIIRMM